jgi:hypothetical protein
MRFLLYNKYIIAIFHMTISQRVPLKNVAQFFEDLTDHHGSVYPVFLVQATICDEHIWAFKASRANSVLCYDNFEEVAGRLKIARDIHQLDLLIMFGNDSGLLLLHLQAKLPLHNAGLTCYIQSTFFVNATFQLNSKLFLYKEDWLTEGYRVFEKYAIKSGPVITHNIGVWTLGSGLKIPVQNIWERRSDLQGTVLLDGIMPFSVIMKVNTNDKGQIESHSGIFPDIMHQLKRTLNFSVTTSPSKDGKWGISLEDGKGWNGLMGELMNKEIDVCSAGLSHIKERDLAVDFTMTLLEERMSLLSPVTKGNKANLLVYMEIFSIETWCICAITLIAISLAFMMINWSGSNNIHSSRNRESFGILNSLALLMMLLMQLDYGAVIRSLSAKILLCFSALMTYLIFSHFTCDLTARMTSAPSASSIRSFQDVIDRGYTVIVMESTASHGILNSEKKGSAMYTVYHNSMLGNPDSFVQTTEESLNVPLTRKNTLLFDSTMMVVSNKRYVDLEITDGVNGQVAWAFQKESEFTDFFNYHLLKLQERGVMHKIVRDWSYSPSESYWVPDAISLGYDNTLFPFLILLGGIVAAALFILIEVYDKCMMLNLMK